ncbi:MAG: hypothetical protein ACLPX9_04645 [Rhodomicrobium sp.]
MVSSVRKMLSRITPR